MRPNETYFKLSGETARIRWADLTRFFAQGRVMRVADGLDLPAVAAAMADDDTAQVKAWKNAGELSALDDATAATWFDADIDVWAVTVAPFVLVQVLRGGEDDTA